MLSSFSPVGLSLLLSLVIVSQPSAQAVPLPFDPSSIVEVRVDDLDRDQVVALTLDGFDVTSVQGRSAFLSLPENDLGALTSRGLSFVRLAPAKPADESFLAAYHSYASLATELQSIAASYPNLCQLSSVGNSVQGRQLWIMKISDNVALQEDEPEFRYISTMHGDEPIGMEMCLNMIHELLDNYGSDPEITGLVDDLEIWILPLMNPDGYTAGSRYNAQGVDLNRDFPDRVNDPVNTTAGRAIETARVMNWGFNHSPVLSANFHSGALVVNYPYDSDPNPFAPYSAAPDDSLFIAQSLAYASLNAPMSASPWFSQGIVNGVEWYLVHGGMQDWNYYWMGCNDVTIELGDTKWPSSSQLPGLWNDNRDAMLAYMGWALRGVRGVVTDALTGQPLPATVTVMGIDHDVFTDPDVGDYHRMVEPGTYTVTIAASGYVSQVIPGVSVGAGDATVLSVALSPEGWSDLGLGLAGTAGQVPTLTGSGPLTASSVNAVDLAAALPGAAAHLVFGLTRIDAGFKGGVLVPAPDLLISGLPIDGAGQLSVPFVWPTGVPAGFPFYLQVWVEDGQGPLGFAASNGLGGEAQ